MAKLDGYMPLILSITSLETLSIDLKKGIISVFKTYLLPVLTPFGFKSPFFRAANRSSQGAPSYDYGPRKSTGKLILLKKSLVAEQVWYLAPSSIITVSDLHPGLSPSSVCARWVKKSFMMVWSVLT